MQDVALEGKFFVLMERSWDPTTPITGSFPIVDPSYECKAHVSSKVGPGVAQRHNRDSAKGELRISGEALFEKRRASPHWEIHKQRPAC